MFGDCFHITCATNREVEAVRSECLKDFFFFFLFFFSFFFFFFFLSKNKKQTTKNSDAPPKNMTKRRAFQKSRRFNLAIPSKNVKRRFFNLRFSFLDDIFYFLVFFLILCGGGLEFFFFFFFFVSVGCPLC